MCTDGAMDQTEARARCFQLWVALPPELEAGPCLKASPNPEE